MDNIKFKIPFGLRTVKTAVAVIIAMLVVDLLGTTDSKLIFAMLGAMAAVQPTFKESVEAFLSQIIGVIFGAIAGILLLALRMPPLVTTGIGDPLLWPQERPVPMRVPRGPFGIPLPLMPGPKTLCELRAGT